MKKDSKRMIRLVLTGMFVLSFLVSCVTLEKIGIGKGTKEGAPAASQPASGTQAEEQAAYPQQSGKTSRPAPGAKAAAKPMSGQQEAEQYFIHQVKWPNESLSIIAKWYTGSLMNWKALARANPDMEPTVIHQGDRIRIPVGMLKTRDPMPEKFVDELIQSLKKKTSPQEEDTQEKKQEEEEPALFGPKGGQDE